MSKCCVEGCNRSKELTPDGYCSICVRAHTMRSASSSPLSGISTTATTGNQPPVSNIPGIDLSSMEHMVQKVNAGEPVDQGELLKGVFGMVFNVAKTMGTMDQVKTQIKSNTDRIDSIEAKLVDKEVSLALGIVIINLPLPPVGVTLLEYARAVFKEVKAPGVDCQVDITKAVRVGFKAESSPGLNDGKLGKVEIEISNSDVKAKIMKSKKILETHSNEILRKLKIFNKKTQEQINQEYTNRQLLKMIPGGSAFYIAGNGQLKQQTRLPNPPQTFPTYMNQHPYSVPPPSFRQPNGYQVRLPHQAPGPRPQLAQGVQPLQGGQPPQHHQPSTGGQQPQQSNQPQDVSAQAQDPQQLPGAPLQGLPQAHGAPAPQPHSQEVQFSFSNPTTDHSQNLPMDHSSGSAGGDQ